MARLRVLPQRIQLRPSTREAVWAYLFLTPNFLLMLIFTVIPVVAGFAVSLTKWDLIRPPRFVGLGNYAELATDPNVWLSLDRTLYFVVGAVPVQIILALLVAGALARSMRGVVLYRFAYFAPVVTATVAVSMVWGWLYQPEVGVINSVLRLVGISGPGWLGTRDWAMPAIIIMSVWKGLGYPMIILLAAIKDVPQEYLEAAEIDGAGRLALFRYVTMPLISPAVFFVVVISIIGSFQVFDQVYVLTSGLYGVGGPAKATLVYVLYLYLNGFKWFSMGYASALAYFLFLIILGLTLLQWWLRRRWVYAEQ